MSPLIHYWLGEDLENTEKQMRSALQTCGKTRRVGRVVVAAVLSE